VPAGLVLVVAQVAYRATMLRGSWFQFDDVVFLTRVNGQPLSADLLLEGYGGHFMPAGFLLTWLFGHTGSLDHTPYAVTLVVMQALASLGMLVLLRSLFGARWAILVPLIVYLTCALSVPAFVWWAAGVNQLPLQVALGWGLAAHVQYLRTRRLRWLLAAVAVMLVCLTFYEKVLLVYGVIALVTVCYFTTDSARDRVRQVWRRHRLALGVHVVSGVAYLAAYAAYASNFADEGAAGYPVFRLGGNLFGRLAVPGVFGGPISWEVLTGPFQVVDPDPLLVFVSWMALLGLVGHVYSRRRRSLRAWSIPLFFAIGDLLLLGSARATALGPIVGLEARYVTEVGMAAALGLALATLELRGADESAEPRDDLPLLLGPEYVVGATVVVAVLGVLSSQHYATHWADDNQTEDFFANADRTLGTPDDPTPLVNVSVPLYIMWGYEYPRNTTQYVLRSYASRMTFPELRVDSISVVDDTGVVRPVLVEPVTRAVFPTGSCSYRATSTSAAVVPMQQPADGIDWWVRMSYRTDEDTAAVITAGDTTHHAELPAGLHNVYFHVGNSFDEVEVALGSSAADRMCVYEMDAGLVAPLEPVS
jgi:hypothetical protein